MIQESKNNSEGNFRYARPLTRDKVEVVVKDLVFRDEIISAKEIMDLLDLSKSSTYDKISTGKFNGYELCVLSRYMVAKYKDFTLANLILPDGARIEMTKIVGEVDESLDDESRDMHIAFGNILEAHVKGEDKETMKWALNANEILIRVIETIKKRGEK